MHKVSTTRAELLAHKEQILLARQGYDLLEQKRTVLVKQFMQIVDKVMEHADTLQQAAVKASQSLVRAEAIAGAEKVQSASLATRGELSLKIKMSNVMGVKIPQITQRSAGRSLLGRGYDISGTPVAVDEAAAAFEDEVEAIVRLAESELHLARLSREIQRTSRRLNALEHVLIPQLENEQKYIQMALDERERSDHFRMKLIKRALQREDEDAR